MNDKVRRYNGMYPGVEITDSQKEERQERIDFKAESTSLRRSMRNRGIIVPDLPWRRDA